MRTRESAAQGALYWYRCAAAEFAWEACKLDIEACSDTCRMLALFDALLYIAFYYNRAYKKRIAKLL